MIILDRDLSGALIGPPEDDPPLVVDADGVVTGQITLWQFKTIARWNPEILQGPGTIHLDQLPKGDPADG